MNTPARGSASIVNLVAPQDTQKPPGGGPAPRAVTRGKSSKRYPERQAGRRWSLCDMTHTKGPLSRPLRRESESSKALAFAELRLLARLVEAGLLALDLAVVAGEEAGALELRAQVLVGLAERLGDAVAHGPGLRRDAAAVHVDLDVELAAGVRGLEGHLGDGLEHLAPKVGVDGAAVDDDRADTRDEGDAGDAGLAFAGRPVGHCIRHALLLDLEHFGPLRLVRMLRARIDLELAKLGAPELGVRQHAAHGVAHDLLGPAGLELGIRLALDTTGVAGMVVVHLLLGLVARDDDLVGVDDDDEIAGVDGGGVDDLALAAQAVRDDGGETAQRVALGVDDAPLLLDGGGLGDVSLHALTRVGDRTRAPRGRAKGNYSQSRRAMQDDAVRDHARATGVRSATTLSLLH